MAVDIDQWLEALGLENYAEVFADSEITFDALPHLREADLKELGLPMGPRRIVSAAIENLALPKASVEPAATNKRSVQPCGAERRQLTVMFCDLVGSTALSSRLDPEETRDIILRYQNAVAGAIARLEGHVARYVGDGVLAYFGFPQAHEDDAERAVRAGMSIIKAVRNIRLSKDETLAARIGIATGLVVVGDLIGEGAAQEEAVFGDTPNIAARLQSVAEPGQVVVAENTRRLLGENFDLVNLGQKILKGVPEPISAFLILAERAVESRFAARQCSHLTSMIGRDQELALLMERWRWAKAGEGQMVLLSGEAGIGKSRIARALTDSLGTDDHTRIGYQCSAYHTDSALYPTIQYFNQAAGFAQEDSLDTKLDKLESVLNLATEDVRNVAGFFAALVGLDGEARYGGLNLPPQQRRARMLEALVDYLIGLANRQPVLFVVEDVHWVDPTTLEFLDLCLDRIANTQVLMLVTARPGLDHSFGGHPILTTLTLNRLGRRDSAAIVANLTGGKSLPPDLLEEMTNKTDGIPLFIEELTKTVLESGMLRECDGAYVLERPLKPLAIPASLYDSLMARLDRIQPLKEVAQTAACIGREFDQRVILAVMPQPEAVIGEALVRLTRAELIFRRGAEPEARYLFKHALVRDAAYESLLKSKRKALHRRILDVLGETDVAPEILALHAKEAGFNEKAIDYYQLAGKRALARPAYLEAIANLREAILLTKTMGQGHHWVERELELQVLVGQAHLGGFGYAASETAVEFRRALELSQHLGNTSLWLPVYYGNWVGHFVRAELPDALRLAQEMKNQTEYYNENGSAMISYRLLGATEMTMGMFCPARKHLEKGLKLYDPDRHRALIEQIGQEPGVALHCYAALTLWALGCPDRAREHIQAAMWIGQESKHPLTIGYALGHDSILSILFRDGARAAKIVENSIKYSEQHGLTHWVAASRFFTAWVLNAAGQHKSALSTIERVRPSVDATGTGLYFPLILSFELEALVALGRFHAAEQVLQKICRRMEVSAERWNESDIRRIEGNLRLAQGETRGAEHCYRQALDIAGDQQARAFALRAATSLARLWAEQGERRKAEDLLTPIYGWFTEGLGTPDLREASDLLHSLE